MTRTPLSRKVAGAFVALAAILVCATQSFAAPPIEPRAIYKSMVAGEVFMADIALMDPSTGRIIMPTVVTTWTASSPGAVKIFNTCAADGWNILSTNVANTSVTMYQAIPIMTAPTSFTPKCRTLLVQNTSAGQMWITILAEYE
jgi:hypothetical protein